MGLTDEEILDAVHHLLSPQEVRDWFRSAIPEIGQSVLALAKADGIVDAARGVRQLYVSWLQQPVRG